MASGSQMILLDTCVLFWLEHEPERISPAAIEALRMPTTACFASSISALELGLKVARGKLKLPLPPGDWLREICRHRGIGGIPVDFSIAGESALLPRIHDDPFDRILIATAVQRSLRLVTPDSHISKYPGLDVLW